MLNVTEDFLLQTIFNKYCINCGLIVKNKWFDSISLQKLFNDYVPFHPKGWDAALGRFTPENFIFELDLFEKAYLNNDAQKINQYKRALVSIIDSIQDPEVTEEKRRFINAIETLNFPELHLRKDSIKTYITSPAPFKRFAGFSSQNLWNYVSEKSNGIKSYYELGCPLWGMMNIAKAKGVPVSFLVRSEPNYWGKNCVNLNYHCSNFAEYKWDINQLSFEKFEKGHVVGFFQYLDH